MNKLRKFFYFHFANQVVMKGELGAFKFVFRRFWLEVSTASGNFKARWTAAEYPYAYLLYAMKQGNEETVQGYFERVYYWSAIILHDKGLADDMDKAFAKYEKRVAKEINTEDEELALREVEEVQKFVEAPKKEQKKMERDINKRFRKAIKKVEDER